MSDKKPFNQTFVGKLIAKGKDILPEKGVLGALKNLIDSDDTLSAEEREEAHRALIEAYKAEVSDRDSARNRQVEIAKDVDEIKTDVKDFAKAWNEYINRIQ